MAASVLGRACRSALPRLTASATRPAAPALFRPAAPLATPVLARSYVTAEVFSRTEVLEKLDELHDEILTTNWADYLYLVWNTPFWEAEYAKIGPLVQPYLSDPAVGAKYAYLQEMMDVYYVCEDVRDHINELAELMTRASGLMGTGYGAGEKVENIDEHCAALDKKYQELLAKHPNFKPKIEQTVGHGLAVLRQKHKFNFSSMYRYFF